MIERTDKITKKRAEERHTVSLTRVYIFLTFERENKEMRIYIYNVLAVARAGGNSILSKK